jgi:hypothetical protein
MHACQPIFTILLLLKRYVYTARCAVIFLCEARPAMTYRWLLLVFLGRPERALSADARLLINFKSS